MWAALGFMVAAGAPCDVSQLVMVGRSPAIHAEVDGHDAILEIDTGSFELRLSPAFADKWNLGSSRVKLKLGTAPTMALSPLVEEIASPDSMPGALKALTPHSDGILGLDILRRFAVGLDTVSGKVTLWYGGNLDATEAKDWAKMPLTPLPLRSHGVDDWYCLDAKVNGHPLNLLLDTGTAYSTVNPSVADELGLRVIGHTPVMEIGHSETLKVAVAKSIEYGPFSADFPVVNIENTDDTQAEGILGTEALGGGKFLIDMPGNTLFLGRGPARIANPLERRLRLAGLDMFPNEAGDLLVLVRPGSSAARLGLDSGDRMISIGDVPVGEMASDMEKSWDSERFQRLMKLGMKAINGDLSVRVQSKGGKVVSLALPNA